MHFDNLVKKARKCLFVIRNLRRANCPPHLRFRSYTSFIRSLLIYTLILRFAMLQSTFTRSCSTLRTGLSASWVSIPSFILLLIRQLYQRSRLDKCGSCCVKPMANRVHIFGSWQDLRARISITWHTVTHGSDLQKNRELGDWEPKHGLLQNISNRY